MAAQHEARVVRRPLTRSAWAVLPAFTLAYAVAVVAGRATRLPDSQLALVWPAAAVAVLWVLHARSARAQRLHASALVLVTVLANLATGASPALAAAFGAANLLQALVSVALLPEGFRLRTVSALGRLVLACTAGALASGLLGTAALATAVGADPASTLGLWAVRNATSTVVLVAVVLRLREHATTARPTAAGRLELAAAAGLTAAGHLLVATTPSVPAGLVLLPLAMWFALRCSTTVACGHVLWTAVWLVLLSGDGEGSSAVLTAQAFLLVTSLVTLTLALVWDERAALVEGLRRERQSSAAQAALLTTVLDTVDVAIVATDADGRPVLVNRTAQALHELVDGGGLPEAVPVDRVLREGRLSDALLVVDVPGRPARTVRSEGRLMRDADGCVLGAVVVQTDVTALHASERQFRAAFEDGPTPTARIDDAGRVEQTNAALRRLLALPSKRLHGRVLADLAVAEDRERLLAAVEDRTGSAPVEVRLVRADGTALWCEVSRTRVRAPGLVPYVLVQLLDVHARKTHELALEDVAHHDALTGLDNRHVLDRRLVDLLHCSGEARVVLAYLDLDGFKAINDQHGHDAGDAVLREVGQRLLRLVRTDDLAARLGGDEFVLACVVPDGHLAEQFADSLAVRLEHALSRPVLYDGAALQVGVSIGVTIAASGCDPVEALHRADLVMYQHKRTRKLAVLPSPEHRPGPVPTDEELRLATLRAYGWLDTSPDAALDDLCRAAALVAGVPTALIGLMDSDRNWFKARCGLDAAEADRDVAPCAYVVAFGEELHIEDTRRDPRFADNPLVTGQIGLRSYAGFPISAGDGLVLGTLCVLGYVPGLLDEAQRKVLRVLASRALALLLAQGPGAAPPGAVPQQRPAQLTAGAP